ncbi:MAG: peptidase S8, partial [Anaerolineae bacterium]
DQIGSRLVTFEGTLFGAEPPLVDAAVDPLASPFGYVGLGGFGSSIDVGATDESIANFNVPAFEYAGETYSQIGIVSNGYVVVGGGTGADVDFINSDLPDAAIPNNVLAPFWTDLNPGAGGRVLVNVLTDGTDTWIIAEWESVPNFGDGETNTAQVWIGINSDVNPGEDISFVYGADVSDGDSSFLTVGAENKFGNSGGTVYFDGVGDPPAPSFPNGNYEVDVFSVPGAPGETHVISFTARGVKRSDWTNCAQMTGDIFFGTNIACVSGEVTR